MIRFALVLLAGLAVVRGAGATEPYGGHRQGYGYDFNRNVYYRLEKTEVVGIPVPANLFVNLSGRPTYAPVTVAPEAYHAERAKLAAAEARAAALEEKVDRLLEMMDRPQPLAARERTDLPPPVKKAPGKQISRVGGAASVERVAQIARVHCADCHGAEKGRGGVSLFDDQLAFRLKGTTPLAFWEAVKDDEMPKKREPLSVEEKAEVERWALRESVAKTQPRRREEIE